LDTPQFAERMAQIRARFAARLATKIEETDAALPILSGEGRKAVDAVAAVYRRLHDVCGIGPTVGFNEVGRAARTLVDGVLVGAFRGERALTADEMAKLKEGYDAFRIAARADMQSMDTKRSI
jgi:chemotaxis protein histidine kinase CheA